MKILIPVDGSDCSEKTLAWAAETLNHTQADYYLLMVIRMLPGINTMEYDIADAVAMLNKAHDFLQRQGCRVIKTEYVLGDPVDEICRYADTHDLDQILIGSHGRSGLNKLLMGSVSEGVLEHCQKPVFLYRNIIKRAAPHVIPGNTVL